jgi:hypothetical protein
MSHPTRVSAPVDLTDVPGGRPVPAGTALDLGAWDVRIPGRADALTTDWGVPAFGTVGDLLRYERPDYIAAAVPWAAMPDAIREVVGHRMPVLAERPPAPDLPGLRTLWTDVGGTGLVQVAKQYLLMPGSFEETLDWVIAYRLEGLQVSEKAFSHTTEAEIADLAQRTSDLGLRLELAGPSVKPGRGGNTVASLRHLSQALCRCRSAGGSTLVEGEV